MYQYQLPQFLIFLSGLLLCVIGTPESLHSADDTEQSSRLEKAPVNTETAKNTTQPHYYIRQLRFDGNTALK